MKRDFLFEAFLLFLSFYLDSLFNVIKIYTITIYIAIARVTHAVFVDVFLKRIPIERAIVASVADLITVAVLLVRIINAQAVVGQIQYAVVVRVFIASVADSILVGVFLAAVRHHRAIVDATATVVTAKAPVGDAVAVAVGTASVSVSGPTDATLQKINRRYLNQ